mmetsp:Transcript_12824/g.34028  ORF Transcript_12824/g.34028 Transcript_12824/m.34028 type:complete len:204 (-) Transcript_12824:803-1414(-)
MATWFIMSHSLSRSATASLPSLSPMMPGGAATSNFSSKITSAVTCSCILCHLRCLDRQLRRAQQLGCNACGMPHSSSDSLQGSGCTPPAAPLMLTALVVDASSTAAAVLHVGSADLLPEVLHQSAQWVVVLLLFFLVLFLLQEELLLLLLPLLHLLLPSLLFLQLMLLLLLLLPGLDTAVEADPYAACMLQLLLLLLLLLLRL